MYRTFGCLFYIPVGMYQPPFSLDRIAAQPDADPFGLDAPLDGHDTPVEGLDTPPDGLDIPTEDHDAPAEGLDTPPDDHDKPAEDHDAPVEDLEVPVEGLDTPGRGADTVAFYQKKFRTPCPAENECACVWLDKKFYTNIGGKSWPQDCMIR